VLQQSLLRKPLHHPAYGGGGKLEEMGDVAGGSGAAFRRQPVNGLEVILDRAGERLVLECGCVHTKSRFRLG
jgi:hypothetical protein